LRLGEPEREIGGGLENFEKRVEAQSGREGFSYFLNT
jgi:hypothetical protein